jgi:hypothetical protein
MRSGEEGMFRKSCRQNCGNTDTSLVPRRYLRNDPKKTSIAANGVLDANARHLLDVPDQVLRHCGAQAFSANQNSRLRRLGAAQRTAGATGRETTLLETTPADCHYGLPEPTGGAWRPCSVYCSRFAVMAHSPGHWLALQ